MSEIIKSAIPVHFLHLSILFANLVLLHHSQTLQILSFTFYAVYKL